MLMVNQQALNKFKADRRTFSLYERKLLHDWFDFLNKVWQGSLRSSYGCTEEGEGWFVISCDTPEGVSTISSFSIEDKGSEKEYRYFCGPRKLVFLGSNLLQVLEDQAPDKFFLEFMEYHTITVYEEGLSNVVQLVHTP